MTLKDAFRDERRRVLAGDSDLAEEAAEIAIGGLQEYDHHESAHSCANSSF